MSEPSGEPAGAPKPQLARRRWWRLLMRPAPDVVALLVAQGELTVAGMDAFSEWSHTGDRAAAEAVRSAQHQAYQARRELLRALQAALSTPVDQEDLFILSERIDRILTDARDTLREAEVLDRAPDSHTAQMAQRLAAGTRALVAGARLLRKDPDETGRRADAANEAVHPIERDYREAMADLLQSEDLRAVFAGQVLYRRYLDIAQAITAVTDRLWFVVLRGV